MVLRASPVMFETAARPPHPAARASLAANNRRPRSSGKAAAHRPGIASRPALGGTARVATAWAKARSALMNAVSRARRLCPPYI
jgi:hypothetical protein